jgi:hypothetical protein
MHVAESISDGGAFHSTVRPTFKENPSGRKKNRIKCPLAELHV